MADTYTSLIEAHAASRPGATALIDRGQSWSYAELAATSRKLASGLAAAGIGKGDRVGFWLPNVAAYIALHLACARLAAVTVSVNTRFRSSEVGDIVGRSGCKALCLWPAFKDIPFLDILSDVEPSLLADLQSVILYDEGEDRPLLPGALDGRRIIAYAELLDQPEMTADHATEDSGVVVFTTSGTTAAPKFVLHDQRGITRHALDVSRFFGWDAPEAVLLQAIPLCGTFGHSQAMATLASGRPMVTMPVFSGPEAARLMTAHRITHTNGSDEMFAALMEAGAGDVPFPHFQSGGYAAFNPAYGDILEQAGERGMTLTGLWGMSEMQALYARQDPQSDAEQRKRAGGMLASPDAEVRIRDPETGEILPHGSSGEIETAGPSRMREYLGDPDATAKVLTEDGYVRTGDLGYSESDGGFVFLARMGDALRLGGFLVNPSEIESHIESHPSVQKVQVVGVDTQAGTRAFACVIPNAGAAFDQGEIMAHCSDGMAKFKVPAGIQAVEDFPVTESANGVKIQKKKLREMASAAMRAM